MCSLVPEISTQLPYACGDDARTRIKPNPHDHNEMVHQYSPIMDERIWKHGSKGVFCEKVQ